MLPTAYSHLLAALQSMGRSWIQGSLEAILQMAWETSGLLLLPLKPPTSCIMWCQYASSFTEATTPCADFGLAQLAQSGSRLQSVLLYHIMPGGAYTLDQLAGAGNVTTLLGKDLGANATYPLQWGRNSTGDVRLWLLFPEQLSLTFAAGCRMAQWVSCECE